MKKLLKKLLISLFMLVTLATNLSAQDVSVSLTRNYINGNTTWDTFFYYDLFHSRLIYPYSGTNHTLGINIEKSNVFMNFEMGLSNYGNLHFTNYDINEGRDYDWTGNFLQHVSSSDIIFNNNDYKFVLKYKKDYHNSHNNFHYISEMVGRPKYDKK